MIQNQRTVLIIDDFPQDRATYRRYLANDPEVRYTILEAESAEDGLALCQQQTLDGILLDFQLPDLDGFEFLARLKAKVGESCPPIVMMSGWGDESVAVKAIKSGAEDYLAKSRITSADLRLTLKTAIENAELRLALRQSEARHQQAEAALQDRESLFRGVFDSNLIGILFWNIQGQITDANDAFCQLMGYSRAELQSGQLSYAQLTPPEYHELDAQKLNQLLATGTFQPIEKEYISKTGQRIPILLGCAFLPGSRDRGVAFVLDRREQAHLQQEREILLLEAQTAREAAEQANRTKDEFLAIVSHELRSPLNAILGWTKLLRSRQFEPERVEQALETIDRNAEAQVQLIEDLLDLSRVLRGQLRLEIIPVQLAPILQVVIANSQLAAAAKQIQLHTHLDPEAGRISGDLNRLQQIFTNLVTNAIKFTPPGGQVKVLLKHTDTDAIVQIQDTGQGISPDTLPHIFEQFRQAENTTTRSKEGLGLGLAIVRHLVELHQGTVQAESPGLGQGATFTVQFPLVDNVCQPMTVAPEMAIAHLSPLKILVVDDIPDTCDYLQFTLQDAGAKVQTAHSAAQAIEVFQQFTPDVLLSDIGMPDADGYALLHHLRQLPQGQSLIAIALTAYAKPEDRDRILSAGFQGYLAKPVEPDALVSAIARYVGVAIGHPTPAAKLADS
ncbi:MAG: response regulator [Oculatellaceae cyanobacterium Prado106]|jgi:hypothetical protein|nr:response regulator [Oculatellaceae cyanobacterium Prado106]